MPANLSPEYRAAADAFRNARDPAERLTWQREMLCLTPKHKGIDHLQAVSSDASRNSTTNWPGPGRAAHSGLGRDELGPWLFDHLGVVRV